MKRRMGVPTNTIGFEDGNSAEEDGAAVFDTALLPAEEGTGLIAIAERLTGLGLGKPGTDSDDPAEVVINGVIFKLADVSASEKRGLDLIQVRLESEETTTNNVPPERRETLEADVNEDPDEDDATAEASGANPKDLWDFETPPVTPPMGVPAGVSVGVKAAAAATAKPAGRGPVGIQPPPAAKKPTPTPDISAPMMGEEPKAATPLPADKRKSKPAGAPTLNVKPSASKQELPPKEPEPIFKGGPLEAGDEESPTKRFKEPPPLDMGKGAQKPPPPVNMNPGKAAAGAQGVPPTVPDSPTQPFGKNKPTDKAADVEEKWHDRKGPNSHSPPTDELERNLKKKLNWRRRLGMVAAVVIIGLVLTGAGGLLIMVLGLGGSLSAYLLSGDASTDTAAVNTPPPEPTVAELITPPADTTPPADQPITTENITPPVTETATLKYIGLSKGATPCPIVEIPTGSHTAAGKERFTVCGTGVEAKDGNVLMDGQPVTADQIMAGIKPQPPGALKDSQMASAKVHCAWSGLQINGQPTCTAK